MNSTTGSRSEPNYIPHVDGLRGLAVALVVIYHAWPALLPGGYIGVDIFFVISGYIITRQLAHEMAQGTFSYAGFLMRRVRRLVPAAAVCFGLTSVAALLVLEPHALEDYARSLIAAWALVANLHFMQTTGYFDGAADEKPLLHTWSLAVEDQFYLTWPLVLLVMVRTFGLHTTWRIAVPVLILASLAHAEWSAHRAPEYAFFSPLTRAYELLAGCWLALVAPMPNVSGKGTGLSSRVVLSVVGLLMIAGSVVGLSAGSPVPGLVLVPTVIGALLLTYASTKTITNSDGVNPIGAVFETKPVRFLGHISYSLYLYHWPVFVLAGLSLGRDLSGAEIAGLIVVSLILATLSWRYVEQPVRRMALAPRRAFRAAICTGVLFCLGAGSILATKGLPGRFEPEVAELYRSLRKANDYRATCDGYENAFRNKAACTFGFVKEPGELDVVVLGDSNADHFVPMISQLTKQAGLSGRQVTQSTCAPLIGVVRASSRPARAEICTRYQEAILELIDKTPNLETVVLSAVWSNWTSKRLVPNRLALDAEAGANATVAFQDVLEETVRKLRERGLKVIIFAQIPFIPEFDTACLTQAVKDGISDDACAIDRSEAEQSLTVPREVLKDLVARYPDVKLFDPSEYLCTDKLCGVFRDKKVLYRDGGHLNLNGAMYLAKYARGLFNEQSRTP